MLTLTIADQLRLNALNFPERVALEVIGGQSLTYQEVWQRACAIASDLRRAGAEKGKPIAVLLQNGSDAAISFFACQLVGCPAMPVNTALTTPELDYIMSDSGARTVLTSASVLPQVQALTSFSEFSIVNVDALTGDVDEESTFEPEPGDVPFIIGYTSGTTGFPKGGIYSADGLYVQYLRWAATFGLTSRDVLLTPGPMFHNSFGGLSVLALMLGARNRIMTKFDVSVAAKELDQQATFAFLVPSMLTDLHQSWSSSEIEPMSTVRQILLSGSRVEKDVVRASFEMFPKSAITEAYGWSEGGWVTYEVKDVDSLITASVGQPMVGADVQIVDDFGKPLPLGEVGEIAVRNITEFLGYLNRGIPEDSMSESGYLLSGDIGRFDSEGNLLLVDRKKDIIVTGGENVASSEVERVISEHPQVLEVAVVGWPDARWGEAVTAVVVTEASISEEELRAYCRERLAGFKTPKNFEFRTELPRNSMGKLQKFLLRKTESSEQA